MKRMICLMVSLLVCFSMVMPAFAAEGEFVPSISYKDGPMLVSAFFNGEDVTDCIVVTTIPQAQEKSTDITQEERDLLLEVYKKLDNGSMTLPLNYNYVIRELVDINFKYNHCREQSSHNEKDIELKKPDLKITIVLDLNIGANVELDVLQYKNNAWSPIDQVTNNGDGTVTLVFEHFCPVAFALKESNSTDTPDKPDAPDTPNTPEKPSKPNKPSTDNPKTGDMIGQNMGLWIAVMAAAAVGLVAVVTIARKKK